MAATVRAFGLGLTARGNCKSNQAAVARTLASSIFGSPLRR